MAFAVMSALAGWPRFPRVGSEGPESARLSFPLKKSRMRQVHPVPDILTHKLAHTLPSKEMEDWAAKLPGMVNIGLPNPHGGRVFIRAVDLAA